MSSSNIYITILEFTRMHCESWNHVYYLINAFLYSCETSGLEAILQWKHETTDPVLGLEFYFALKSSCFCCGIIANNLEPSCLMILQVILLWQESLINSKSLFSVIMPMREYLFPERNSTDILNCPQTSMIA